MHESNRSGSRNDGGIKVRLCLDHSQQQGWVQAGQLPLIEQLLAQDPRPAYQGLEKNRPDALREYGMAYDRVNVRFVVGPEGLTVVAVQPVTGLLRDPADESGPEVFPAD